MLGFTFKPNCQYEVLTVATTGGSRKDLWLSRQTELLMNMENLASESYGVDTLNFDEMLCIDGGRFWHDLGCVLIVVGIIICML